MSVRARHARRLASLLSEQTGVFVMVRYDRLARRYSVVWAGGPDRGQMRDLAAAYAVELEPLDLSELLWCRACE